MSARAPNALQRCLRPLSNEATLQNDNRNECEPVDDLPEQPSKSLRFILFAMGGLPALVRRMDERRQL